MHKRRKTTVTGEESSADITKQLNEMSHTEGDEPDVVGVGEPNQSKRLGQDRGSQRTGKGAISLKMSQGNANSSRFDNINRLDTEQENILDLKDAIIELYLAIKIRSTEEVSHHIAFARVQGEFKARLKPFHNAKLLEF